MTRPVTRPAAGPAAPRHGYTRALRQAAHNLYDVDAMIHFYNTAVPEGFARWRCIRCGWGLDVGRPAARVIAKCACGGCGATTLRPLGEWGKEWLGERT